MRLAIDSSSFAKRYIQEEGSGKLEICFRMLRKWPSASSLTFTHT